MPPRTLRSDSRARPGLRREVVALALVTGALALLAALPSRAEAGVSEYPSTLYLAGPASTIPGHASSYRLIGSLQSAPTLSAAPGGSLSAGTYAYIYTVDTGSGEAPSESATVPVALNDAVTVGGLPTGAGVTVRIYRLGPDAGACYGLITTQPDNASSTFVDTVASPSCSTSPPSLPRSENRAPAAVTNTWYDFAPNTIAPLFGDTVAAALPLAHNGKGWIVQGPGNVHFPAGTWRFVVETRSIATSGAAKITVGLWKVRDDGSVSGPILAPTDGTQTHAVAGTVITSGASLQTTTVELSPGAFSLAANEHLYVQLWRHQTSPYVGFVAPANRTATLFFSAGKARLEHPGAVPDPSLPAQTAPADGATVTAWPDLEARFDDPVAGDTGTLDFQLCADSACSSVLESGSVAGLANGATGTWSPTASGYGTYHWRVRAQDAGGGVSEWSSARSFLYQAAPPPSPPPSPPSSSGGSSSSPAPVPASAPAAPTGFGGRIGPDGLTLAWQPPAAGADVVLYALHVDGAVAATYPGTAFEAKLGPFDPADGRTFALAAQDAAGNWSPLTPALVGVPDLLGHSLAQAQALAAARGLVVVNGRHASARAGGPSDFVVVEQLPEAPALVSVGSDLSVVVTEPYSAKPLFWLSGAVSCRGTRLVTVRVSVRERARVRAVLVARRGRGPWRPVAATTRFLRGGAATLRLPARRRLDPRARYELRLTATSRGPKHAEETAVRVSGARGGGLRCFAATGGEGGGRQVAA